MILRIPEPSLVVLVGPSGAGKSTFARHHFRPTEVLSSDACRAWISDDENDQSATGDAFEILHDIAAKRLARGRLTVVDATSVTPEARKPWIDLARRHHATPVAIVFHLPEEGLADEGFRVWTLRSPAEVEAVRIERQPSRPDSASADTPRRPLVAFALGHSGVDPRWLIYVPPAPALPDASRRPGFLEHPDEMFAHFRAEGIGRAVCEETLGGTHAVAVVCRDEEEARRRFGGAGEGIGAVWTRSAQRVFAGAALEKAFLVRLRDALGQAGFWERLGTGWACLEGELTPWSLGAGEALRNRYATVGAAARTVLPKAVARLAEMGGRGIEVRELLARYRERYELAVRFVEAYRRCCRRVRSAADLRFAPFHLLATEGAVHADKDRAWHLDTLAEVCRAGPELLVALPYVKVDLGDPASEAAAVHWWEERKEGMAVKPLAAAAPAMLCRSREALRLVYGPEYTLPENLERLRSRGVPAGGSSGRRELEMATEGLERFVRGEPLGRVHECVLEVLASSGPSV